MSTEVCSVVCRPVYSQRRFNDRLAAIFAVLVFGVVATLVTLGRGHRDRVALCTSTVVVREGDTLWDLWVLSTERSVNWSWWRTRVYEQSPARRHGKWLEPGEMLYVPCLLRVVEGNLRFQRVVGENRLGE